MPTRRCSWGIRFHQVRSRTKPWRCCKGCPAFPSWAITMWRCWTRNASPTGRPHGWPYTTGSSMCSIPPVTNFCATCSRAESIGWPGSGCACNTGRWTLPGKARHALPDTPDETLVRLARGSDCPYVLFGHSHVQFRRTIDGQQFINPGSVGQNRCGKLLACYGVFEDGIFHHRQVEFDPGPWLEAVDRIPTLDAHPDFREWLKQGLLRGYGVGVREPWTRYARQGYF